MWKLTTDRNKSSHRLCATAEPFVKLGKPKYHLGSNGSRHNLTIKSANSENALESALDWLPQRSVSNSSV